LVLRLQSYAYFFEWASIFK